MTKKELYEAVVAACTEYGIEGEARTKLEELVKPKKGGQKVSIEDIALFDEDNNITHILDSVFNVYVPVLNEEGEPNFYEKPDTELGWSRYSRAAEKARKDAEKKFKASKEAIFADLMEGTITNDEAKALMGEAEAARKNVSIPEEIDFIKPEDV